MQWPQQRHASSSSSSSSSPPPTKATITTYLASTAFTRSSRVSSPASATQPCCAIMHTSRVIMHTCARASRRRLTLSIRQQMASHKPHVTHHTSNFTRHLQPHINHGILHEVYYGRQQMTGVECDRKRLRCSGANVAVSEDTNCYNLL